MVVQSDVATDVDALRRAKPLVDLDSCFLDRESKRLGKFQVGLDSDRDQVKKLNIGYSDEVSVFLNGKILYRGRAAQGFREPGFLGIVSPEDDAVYLPLKKGSNELTLAVGEIGGGWGFICRLADLEK